LSDAPFLACLPGGEEVAEVSPGCRGGKPVYFRRRYAGTRAGRLLIQIKCVEVFIHLTGMAIFFRPAEREEVLAGTDEWW
jgi:hypothetical protein